MLWARQKLLLVSCAVVSIRAAAFCGSATTIFTIASQVDADALSTCTYLNGSVAVVGNALQNVTLSGVEQIAHSLVVRGCSSLLHFSAPNLRRVFGLLDIEANGPKTTINLPAFATSNGALISGAETFISPNWTTVTGWLNFTGNTVTSLSFTALTSLSTGGWININNNAQLANLSLPQFKSSGNLLIKGNAALASISLPKVSALQSLVITDNPVLTTISAPILTVLSHDLYWNEAFTITNNPRVANIDSFQFLSSILGIATLSGEFAEVTFPHLASVYGAFRLNTTVHGFNCVTFDELAESEIKGYSVLADLYHCSAIIPGSSTDTAVHLIPPSPLSTPPPLPSPPPQNGRPLSELAKAGIILGCAAIFILLFTFAALCYRNSKRGAARRAAAGEEVGLDTILPRNGADRSAEEPPPRYKENESDDEASELESVSDVQRRRPEFGYGQQADGEVDHERQIGDRERADAQTEFENAIIADGTSATSREDLGHGSRRDRDGTRELETSGWIGPTSFEFGILPSELAADVR